MSEAKNSSVVGFLQPVNPLESREDIEDSLHDLLSGITGLPGCMVRPKWPKTAVSIPEAGIDWCAFGIVEEGDGGMPGERHVGTGDGCSIVAAHQPFVVLVSFYGDNSRIFARKLHMGLALAQNREELYRREMAVVDVGTLVHVPEVAGQVWNDRWDMRLTFRRRVANIYPVLNIKSFQTVVRAESGLKVKR